MPTLGLILIVAIPIALAIATVLTPERVAPIPQRPKFKLADYWLRAEAAVDAAR